MMEPGTRLPLSKGTTFALDIVCVHAAVFTALYILDTSST